MLRLPFIKCAYMHEQTTIEFGVRISSRCGWYVSQKCSSLPVLAVKSEGSEFGVPPSVYTDFSDPQIDGPYKEL